jgi:hypothetical protein
MLGPDPLSRATPGRLRCPARACQSGAEVRERFLSFFEGKGHARLPSSSLVPEDPTVLLTIAGGQQGLQCPRCVYGHGGGDDEEEQVFSSGLAPEDPAVPLLNLCEPGCGYGRWAMQAGCQQRRARSGGARRAAAR